MKKTTNAETNNEESFIDTDRINAFRESIKNNKTLCEMFDVLMLIRNFDTDKVEELEEEIDNIEKEMKSLNAGNKISRKAFAAIVGNIKKSAK